MPCNWANEQWSIEILSPIISRLIHRRPLIQRLKLFAYKLLACLSVESTSKSYMFLSNPNLPTAMKLLKIRLLNERLARALGAPQQPGEHDVSAWCRASLGDKISLIRCSDNATGENAWQRARTISLHSTSANANSPTSTWLVSAWCDGWFDINTISVHLVALKRASRSIHGHRQTGYRWYHKVPQDTARCCLFRAIHDLLMLSKRSIRQLH